MFDLKKKKLAELVKTDLIRESDAICFVPAGANDKYLLCFAVLLVCNGWPLPGYRRWVENFAATFCNKICLQQLIVELHAI